MKQIIIKPQPEEYNSYYHNYIKLIGTTDLLTLLKENLSETISFLKDHLNLDWNYRYESGKWSVKDVVRHINDTERIFAIRAMRIARGEKSTLSGFDENSYAASQDMHAVSPEKLIEEFDISRRSSLNIFESIDVAASEARCMVDGSPLSARAAGFIIVGHTKHHTGVLCDRYFSGKFSV